MTSPAGFAEYAAVGLGAGCYGTIIGAGGGSLIVPALLLVFRVPVQTAVGMSLWAVFANAASGTASYARQRTIDYPSGMAFAGGVIPGAILGALLTRYLPLHAFSALFGIFLLVMGTAIIRRPDHGLMPPREKVRNYEAYLRRELQVRRIVDREGHAYSYYVNRRRGVVISFGTGILSSLLGIGGGIAHVPAMILLLRFPAHVAIATSHFVLAVSSVTGALMFTLQGGLAWRRTLALSAGAIVGAQVGARIGRRLSGTWLRRLLAAALLVVGARMLVLAVVGF